MDSLVKYRQIVIAIVVIFCALGGRFISTALDPNNDLEVWFDKSDPALQAYYEFQEVFGNDRIVTVAYKEEEGILNTTCLQKIDRVQKKLEQLDGVDKVLSIVDAKDFKKIVTGSSITMEFSSWFENGLEQVDEALAADILNSSLYTDRLINKKGDVTLIIIQFESFDLVHKKMDKIIPQIKGLCYEEFGSDKAHLMGADIITFGLNELSRRDFIKFTGLSYVIMFVMIALFYRRLAYVLISFMVALTALWLTFAIYGFFGFGINIFTVMTPTLVIIICIMMSMHIFNEFENSDSNEFDNRKEKATHCLSQIVRPCFYAALTTMIGFLSLLTSSTAVIKEFGWLTAAGCFLAFVMAFAWCGLILPYIDVKRQRVNRIHNLGSKVSHLCKFILKKRRTFLFVSIFLALAAIVGILNINIDMSPMGYFPSSNTVVKDHRFMEENWGDYYPIDIILETAEPRKIDDIAIIRSMIDFDSEILEKQLARNTFSYVQVMERFAQVRYGESLNDILKSPFRIRHFVNSFKRLVENDSDILVTDDQSKARITITGSLQSVRVLESSIEELKAISENVFNDAASIKVSGYPALFVKIMNTAFDSMKSSLIVALILVFAIIYLLLRNLKIALIAMAVNVFPVMAMLAFLGFCKINLDLATCTIAAIILGIAIDDTIHIIYRFQQENKEGISVDDALISTHFHIGRVVILTSVVLFAGFSILLLASLKTVFFFGLISLVSVLAILFGDIVLLTLLLKKWA